MSNKKITTHLKLPFQFDEQKLIGDLNQILKKEWLAHFNSRVYEGHWTSLPLYAPNGDAKNINAPISIEEGRMEETIIIQNCPYFKEVLNTFKCTLLSVRLLNLGVGSQIKPHRDHELGYENGCFRLHIPITTNPNVEFILDDQSLLMLPGECWYTNVNFTHSVSNTGDTDRIHLVVDGERNEWSDNLFFSLTNKETLLTQEIQVFDMDTIAKIQKELERTKPEGYENWIEKLKTEAKEH